MVVSENPYAAPESDSGTTSPGHMPALELARQGQRLWNFLGDSLAILFLWEALLLISGNVLRHLGGEGLVHRAEPVVVLLTPVVYVAYYTICECTTGRTLAKVLTRTKVVNLAGARPTANQALARTLFRLIPLDPFSYFSDRPRGWHDRLSNTVVVHDSHAL